jgi:hypothetical protein
VTTARVHIEEWRFGDERWVFNVGANRRLYCDVLDPDKLTSLLQVWDEECLRDVRYAVGDGPSGEEEVLEGVITSIAALECRFPSSAGGEPLARSGVARQVEQARGWTGDVDASEGLIVGFVIDIELAT